MSLPLAYYNEIEPYAAQWLRNLIAEGHIAPGDVDERSIEDVHPDDLKPYTQCHFFAGIGIWSLALRRAGWPDSRPVWTGSCPCQPFSAAGQGAGFDDQRHLWPHFHWLINQRRPPEILGEQVASKDADPWLDLVQADMEAMAYAFGAVAFPSAGIGASHIRDRTYWVANSKDKRHQRSREARQGGAGLAHGGNVVGLDNTNHAGLEGLRSRYQTESRRLREIRSVATASESSRMAYADLNRQQTGRLPIRPGRQIQTQTIASGLSQDVRPGPVNGLWRDADWLFCRDGKWRPVESGTFPLAHGDTCRVGRLRAYGNAINAEAAAQFIAAYIESAA